MPDPCADKNLTKIRICLMTVWTKFWEIFGNAWPICADRSGSNLEGLIQVQTEIGPKCLEIYMFSGVWLLTTHAWASDTSSMHCLNLPVQIFEHMYGCQFRAKSQGQALHTSKFGLLTSSQLLRTLSHPPKTVQTFNAHTNTRRSRHLQSIEYSSLRY